MKKFLFVILLITSYFTETNAQWNKLSTGQTSIIDKMSVVDDMLIWVMDQHNESISYTVDGGVNWTTKQLPFGYEGYFGGFCAVSASTAYIIRSLTEEKGIYKTTDGAETWVFQPTGFNAESVYPDFIYFWNENEGVAVGDPSTDGYFEIYTTINGGEQWNRVPDTNIPIATGDYTYYSNNYFRVHGNTFYFITNKGKIFRSLDKGYHWSVIDTPEEDGTYLSFDFKNFLTGILTYSDNYDFVYRQYITNDGGQTWETLNYNTFTGDVNYHEGLQTFFTTNFVKGMSYSNDDGQTWTIHPSLMNVGTMAAGFLPSGRIFMGGWSGYIYTPVNYLLENTTISNIWGTGNTSMDIIFSYDVIESGAENSSNYVLRDWEYNTINITSAILDENDHSVVHITTGTELPYDSPLHLSFDNIEGADGYPVLGHGFAEFMLTIQEINENPANSITLFTNSSGDLLNLTGLDIEATEIYDVSGKLIIADYTGLNQINISCLRKGIYIVKNRTNNEVFSQKFIKR